MTPGHCYLHGDAGAGCHQQLGSPNTQGFILPPAQLPRESHVQGITCILHPFQGRKAGKAAVLHLPARAGGGGEGSCLDLALETHGETTISSKLCICWSSAAALTSRGCALLDPYVTLCNQSQDPTVGFVGPHLENAPEPKRFPGSYNQAASSFLPQVFLTAETSLSFPPLSHRPGSSGGVPCSPWTQAVHPNSPSSLLVSGEKHPQMCPQPPQLSLTLHFPVSSSHLFLTGPSSLFSLVPSSSGWMDVTPRGFRSTRAAWKCFGVGRGVGSRSSLEQRNSRSCQSSSQSPPVLGRAGSTEKLEE